MNNKRRILKGTNKNKLLWEYEILTTQDIITHNNYSAYSSCIRFTIQICVDFQKYQK